MEAFEELRNTNNVLYKLTGKLSVNKEANITIVPKTKLVYMHINDNSKAYKNGSFEKALSKSVSLSLAEALKLKRLMSTMDPKVTELVNSVQLQSGKKRKYGIDEPAEAAEAMLNEFNAYQPPANSNQQQLQAPSQGQQPTANSFGQSAANNYQAPPPYAYQSAANSYQQQTMDNSYYQQQLPTTQGQQPAANGYQQQPAPPSYGQTAANSYQLQPPYVNGYQQSSGNAYQQPTSTDQQYYAQYQQSTAATQGRMAPQNNGCQQPNVGYNQYDAGNNNYTQPNAGYHYDYYSQVGCQNGNQ